MSSKKEQIRNQNVFLEEERDTSAAEDFDATAIEVASPGNRYYFFPAWRAQIFELISFFALSYVCIQLTKYFEGSSIYSLVVVPGELFSFGDKTYMMHLPLLTLIPGFVLTKILYFMYNAKYIIDERGVEAQIGLVSLKLRQPRLRYEDIRGVEPVQTILQRILGIGDVHIGSAAQQEVEIIMEGIPDPRKVQLLVQGARDRRIRNLQKKSFESEELVSSD
ncbi:PH domain-containing protein [bacterium]|nr:PH domain-containing protein [bacterium]